jgi:hypothetical protein
MAPLPASWPIEKHSAFKVNSCSPLAAPMMLRQALSRAARA